MGHVGMGEVQLDLRHQRASFATGADSQPGAASKAPSAPKAGLRRIEIQPQALVQRAAVHARQLRHHLAGGGLGMHESVRSGDLGQLHHAVQRDVAGLLMHVERAGAQAGGDVAGSRGQGHAHPARQLEAARRRAANRFMEGR